MRPKTRKSPLVLRKSSFSRLILRWYAQSARQFPWRNEKDPYRILVSEVMLQQTQTGRALEKYPQFIKRFPTFSSLADAGASSVIRAWRGMGYNKRAVHLHQLAKIVATHHGGILPGDIDKLLSLPGIGKYTAHALACFAFHKHVPVVDTNIRRVLSRVFPAQTQHKDIWELAALSLPQRNAYDWNQALMDLGSTICTVNNPKCDVCPVSRLCPSSFRVKRTRTHRPMTELSRNGLPDRIYRGRIVETLRHRTPGKHIAISRLGPQIKATYSRRDEAWLVRLMRRLERDGLVQLRQSKRGLAASLAQ
jgi:A/G-specific adenine glycosylase